MSALRVGGDETGCVLRIETGVALVLTDAGSRRASYAARMLGRVARDPALAPQAGDWVTLRRWPDGRCTLEDCLTTPRAPAASGVVAPLRRARGRR